MGAAAVAAGGVWLGRSRFDVLGIVGGREGSKQVVMISTSDDGL